MGKAPKKVMKITQKYVDVLLNEIDAVATAKNKDKAVDAAVKRLLRADGRKCKRQR